MNMWDQVEHQAKQQDQRPSAWLKLANDGDKAVVVFLGEPLPRETAFVDGKYVVWDEALRAAGHKPSLRVAINVALYPSREVKVLEQGIAFFKDVLRLREKYKGLDTKAFEVERHGVANDPKTTYSILPEQELSADERRAFTALPLHDLERLYAASTERKPAGSALTTYDTTRAATATPAAPTLIDATTANALTVVLKALPGEAATRFCTQFGVRRIKDLPAALAEKAVAFVDQLEAEHRSPPPDAEPSVDPFA